MKKRVGIIISGGGSNMVSLVKAMQADPDFPAEPVVVLSNKPEAAGLVKAEALGIKTAVVDHRPFGKDRGAFEEEMNKVLDAEDVEIICLAGFMRITTPDFPKKWEGRMLNIHPSLLPKFKGLHPQQQALDAGESESGCSVHVVTAELDGGPVVGQASVPIHDGDTVDDLSARIMAQEHKLYPAVLRNFAAGNTDLVSL